MPRSAVLLHPTLLGAAGNGYAAAPQPALCPPALAQLLQPAIARALQPARGCSGAPQLCCLGAGASGRRSPPWLIPVPGCLAAHCHGPAAGKTYGQGSQGCCASCAWCGAMVTQEHKSSWPAPLPPFHSWPWAAALAPDSLWLCSQPHRTPSLPPSTSCPSTGAAGRSQLAPVSPPGSVSALVLVAWP